MNAETKLMKAKVQLILENPFFATLALRMNYLADENIKTACTNGKQIKYNPGYVDSLTLDELKGVLAHEVMHTAMLHQTRRANREPRKWNHAADYAINPLLISSGFALPEGCLISKEYQSKSAEQIYNLLPDIPPDKNSDKNKSSQSQTTGGGTGDVEDAPVNFQETEAEMKQVLVQAAMVAKRQGKLPAHLEKLVKEILQPRICWREVLARFLAEIARNDYTWKKPSPRFLYCGLYLPLLENEEAGKIILIVDTSGSINNVLINQFAGEVQEISSTFNTSLQIIYVDAKVSGIQDIDRDEPVQLQPKGGGGTNFKPGFDYIEKNDLQPKAVVYLTDGECDLFPLPPDYPVLWAQFGNSEFTPPFGEVVNVAD